MPSIRSLAASQQTYRAIRLVLALCLVIGVVAGPAPRSADADTVIATTDVGINPRAVAVNPVNGKVYVANGSSSRVSIIDGTTNDVIATPIVGSGPRSLAVNSVNGKVYVTNSSS